MCVQQASERYAYVCNVVVPGRNFFTDAFRSKSSSGAPTIVTGLSLTADGLLSCGLDGYVKLHPFL